MRFSVPVVLIVFNRPEETRRLFEVIRALRPLRLIVIQDGPRENHPDDIELCAEVRRIVTAIDWPCQADGIFSETNMSCAHRVITGLDQVFLCEKSAIILEDDCIPNSTFFQYCEEILERYADDERIMAVSGDNFLFGEIKQPYSYYYSRYFHCWGWATWRRVWEKYDHSMPYWPDLKKDGWLNSMLDNNAEVNHWTYCFDYAMSGHNDVWDYSFVYTIWRNNGLVILPRDNLVSNIGFGNGATHTVKSQHPYANMATTPMALPLSHPPHMVRDFIADGRYSIQNYLNRRGFSSRW